MSTESDLAVHRSHPGWREALRWAAAFLASFRSPETRRGYRHDLHCWFAYCALHELHPYRAVRRTHIELSQRYMQAEVPAPANATLYRRIATLSSWFAWLEDEEVSYGNPRRGCAADQAPVFTAHVSHRPLTPTAVCSQGEPCRDLFDIELSCGSGHDERKGIVVG